MGSGSVLVQFWLFFELKVFLGNRFFQAQTFFDFSIGHRANLKFRTLWRRGQLRVLFLEPFTRSEPKKSNPEPQGNDDVQKMRTLRAPDLSKVHLGAGGEKLKFLTSKFVLEIDFFDHGFF